MIIKKHVNEGKLILALCDKELIGKKIEDKNLQLDLSSNFYKGEEAGIKEIEMLAKKAQMVNAVGKKSVELLVKIGLVDKKNILYIKDVPHAQVLIFTG